MDRRYHDTLSGGQQQRVALARALATEPHVMLLDEPFSGLDPALRGQICEQTVEALRAIGTTCIIVTHDAEEAMTTADHLVVMRDGHIVQQGDPEHCYHDPIDEDVMRLFGRCTGIKAHVQAGILHSPVGAWPYRGPDGSGRLLIREEAFHVSRNEAGECGGVTTKVEETRNLGAESRTLFRIGEDLSIVVRHPHHHRLRIGEEVHLICDEDLTCFFPSEQEGRA